MRAKLKAIRELRRRMHQPIPVQGTWLGQVVSGWFNYHAAPTNSRALCALRFFVTNLWRQSWVSLMSNSFAENDCGRAIFRDVEWGNMRSRYG